MDLTLKGVGLCIGVLLLLKAPNYVSSQDQEVAVWANLSFLVCLIIALAINLWGTGRLLLSLWRERDQMLPARQHYRSGDAETDQPEMRVLIDRQAHLTNHVIRPAKTSPKLGVVRPIYVLRHS